jgi:hypothetical protein
MSLLKGAEHYLSDGRVNQEQDDDNRRHDPSLELHLCPVLLREHCHALGEAASIQRCYTDCHLPLAVINLEDHKPY